MQPLGIIAGAGDLPEKIARAWQGKNRPVFVLAIEGFADPEFVKNVSHKWWKLGNIQQALDILKENQIQDLTIVGRVKRPSLKTLGLDKTGAKWLAKIGLKAFGDDGLLSGILQLLEQEGLRIVKAQDIINDLMVPQGTLTTAAPNDQDWQDIRRGVTVMQEIGKADIGQAVIIEDGVVLAVEGVEGTDAMILRTHELKRRDNAGVLVKMVKPQQSRAVDMPTTGLKTVQNAIKIGLKGMAIQANGTLVMDREEMINLANQHGFFIEAIEG